MLSIINKKEIVKKVNSEIKTDKQIRNLIFTCQDILKGNIKQYRGDYKGSGRHTQYVLNKEVSILKNLLCSISGNDAPKNGKIGDYIIFKNNVKNKDILIFLVEYLTIIIK